MSLAIKLAFVALGVMFFYAHLMCAQSPSTEASSIRNQQDLVRALAKSSRDDASVTELLKAHSQLLSVDIWQAFQDAASKKYYENEPDRAFVFYNLARLIAIQLNHPKLLATTYYNIARSYSGLGQYEKARLAYLESQKAFIAAGFQRDLIYVLSDLGTLSLLQEKYEDARSYSQESIRLADQFRRTSEPAAALPDDFGVAGSLSTLGELAAREGDYRSAVEYFHQALKLFQELRTSNDYYDYYLADVNASLGRAYTSLGDYRRGLAFLNTADDLAKAVNRPDQVAAVMNSIGFLYLEQEEYEQADSCFEKSLRSYQERNNRREAARVFLNLAVTQQRQGNFDRALEFFSKSLATAQAMDLKDIVIAAKEGIGVVLLAQRSTAEALATFEEGLNLAVDQKDQMRQAEIMWRMSELNLAQKKFVEAVSLSHAALAIAQRQGLSKLAYLTETTLGLAYEAQDKTEPAITAFSHAVDEIELSRSNVAGSEQERSAFFERRLVPYHKLIEIYLKQGKSLEALLIAERAKGRVLLDAIGNARPDQSLVLSTDEKQKLQKLNQRISDLNRSTGSSSVDSQLIAARVEYQALQNALYASHPELGLRAGITPSITAHDLNQLVKLDTAYLEYVVTDNHVFLFVLTNKAGSVETRIYPLSITPQALREKVEEFHDMMAQRHPAYSTIARELYDTLISPAAPQLKNSKTLCVVPDGFLWNVPFQALMSRNDRFLIEDSAIYYAPSLNVLEQLNSKRINSMPVSLLAFGNPAIANRLQLDEELCPLPEAEAEVKSIAHLVDGMSKPLIGREATEVAFNSLAPKYSIIHFATHGILDNRNPLYSYLLLTRTDEQPAGDGLLEAREIMNMKINADLAVLSACETANGKIAPGEGVIGMSWAFFVAGSRSVLVSQWKVNSASTSQLMTNFYRTMRIKTFLNDKASSVREAALGVMKTPGYKHPFYWAGFVLVGQN